MQYPYQQQHCAVGCYSNSPSTFIQLKLFVYTSFIYGKS